MDKKKKVASKMESKTYTNTRCGHCGKFGHSHDKHGIKDLPYQNSPSGGILIRKNK